MVDIVLKTEKQTYTIPDFPVCWEETNTRIYQNLIRDWQPEITDPLKRDPDKLFHIIAGQKYPFSIINMRGDSAVGRAISFVYDQPKWFENLPLPNFIIIEGKKHKIPMKLKELTIGQNIILKQLLQKEKDLRVLIAKAVSIYMQPFVDQKPFNEGRAEEIEEEVLEMPITQTYALGFFLLSRLTNSGWKLPTGFLYLMGNLMRGVRRYFRNSRRSKDFIRTQI